MEILKDQGPGWRNLKIAPVLNPDVVSNFDFLYPYTETPNFLDLYYMHSHGKIEPIYISVKGDIHVGSKLTLGLMSNLRSAPDQDLAIRVIIGDFDKCSVVLREDPSGESPQDSEDFILRKGISREVTIEKGDKAFCLQPLSAVDRYASYYKLLIAYNKGARSKRTYAATLRFRRYLPTEAMYVLVLAIFFVAWSGLDCLLERRDTYVLFRFLPKNILHWLLIPQKHSKSRR